MPARSAISVMLSSARLRCSARRLPRSVPAESAALLTFPPCGPPRKALSGALARTRWWRSDANSRHRSAAEGSLGPVDRSLRAPILQAVMTMVPPVHQLFKTPRPGKAVLAKDDVAAVIAIAARAPSLHNTQPWKFRVEGDVIELLADSRRQLRHLDPDGRELTISCGAALFGLRLGLRGRGYIPVVDLLPDLARPELLARVRPDGRAAA